MVIVLSIAHVSASAVRTPRTNKEIREKQNTHRKSSLGTNRLEDVYLRMFAKRKHRMNEPLEPTCLSSLRGIEVELESQNMI